MRARALDGVPLRDVKATRPPRDFQFGSPAAPKSRQYPVVTSWRDTASQQAQDDLDGLLRAAFPFAEEMLAKHGELFPYAVALSSDGGARMIAGDPGTGDRPLSADVLATLVASLRGDRDSLRATAIVADVRVDGGDALRAEIEHREGQAIAAFLPYEKKRFGRGIEYGALTASAAVQQVWND